MIYNFKNYQEEIELIRAQNGVECELYSIIACIIRSRENSGKISLRDVSTRRRTKNSKVFWGCKSGFPDFVILKRESEKSVLGAIEIKYIDKNLDDSNYAIRTGNFIKEFPKTIFTNGLQWRMYESAEKKWEKTLGVRRKNCIKWCDCTQWHCLMKKLDEINW